MNNKLKIRKFARSLYGLHWRSWSFVIFIFGIVMLLGLNLVRVVANAQANYEVYVFEQEGLKELEQEHAELQRELSYYTSAEYKRLYARDNLRLAEEQEKLYEIREDNQFFDVRQQDVEFFASRDYSEWWLSLL